MNEKKTASEFQQRAPVGEVRIPNQPRIKRPIRKVVRRRAVHASRGSGGSDLLAEVPWGEFAFFALGAVGGFIVCCGVAIALGYLANLIGLPGPLVTLLEKSAGFLLALGGASVANDYESNGLAVCLVVGWAGYFVWWLSSL